MDPGSEALAEVHLQPTNQWTLDDADDHNESHRKIKLTTGTTTHKLFFLVGGQFSQFRLSGRQLLFVIGEVTHHEPARGSKFQ